MIEPPRNKPAAFLLITIEALLLITSVSMAFSMRMPAAMIAGLGMICAAAACAVVSDRCARWGLIAGWIITVVLWLLLFFTGSGWFVSDVYYLAIAGMLVAATVVVGFTAGCCCSRARWWLLGWTWALLTCLTWIIISYRLNQFIGFHAALAMTVLVLIGYRFLFRPRPIVIQLLHTVILLLVALPIVDAFLRPDYRFDQKPETARRYYSYEAASEDPNSFARWWYYSIHQWGALHRQIFQSDPTGRFPVLFRPGATAKFFESRVTINSLGFRGPEIDREKGDAYRIVALGESTTFGVTMGEGDIPWPRLLERLIELRLAPDRPVQVINAGFPGYDLRLNLRRLKQRILPLQPDMIISYHGYNGFGMLDASLPPVMGRPPPSYRLRPLKLLADAEYRIRVMRYRHDQAHDTQPSNVAPANPMKNEYADAYRQLIQISKENGIRLVLANYSMAVNATSNPDVIAFYRTIFPTIYSQIRANRLHSQIIEQLCCEHPEIIQIDTHPVLDGQHEKFTDIIHHTKEGREALSEVMFEGIEDVLCKELSTQARGY